MPVPVGNASAAPAGTGPRLVATPDPASSPPGIVLQVAGVAANSEVVITRADPDGRVRPVRWAEPLRVDAGGTGSVIDHEMPHNAPVRYQVSALVLASDVVQVDSPDVWLINPGIPATSVRVPTLDVEEIAARTFNPTATVGIVPGRTEAVITVMGADVEPTTSSITVRTESADDGVKLANLLRSTTTVLLQVPAWAGQSSLWEYVHFTSREAQPITRGITPALRWPLPYVVSARPSGRSAPLWTWDRAEDAFATWDDVTAAYDTWDDFTLDRRRLFAP